MRGGESWYREHRIRGVDGRYHAVLAQGVPIRGEDGGKVIGWAGINLDIGRLKETEEALREADRRKDEFLATLAHELRNPLAPIRHATLILESPVATAEQRQWGRAVIARQVQHMALLLDDLLDVSRITRGRLELKREVVNVESLVNAAIETARPLIESRHHKLDGRPADGTRDARRGSAARLAGVVEPADERRQVHRRRRQHHRPGCGASRTGYRSPCAIPASA